MKRLYPLITFLLLFPFNQICKEDVENQTKNHVAVEEEKSNDRKIILSHFGGVVNNMFNIMQNTDDPNLIGKNVAEILAHFVGMVVYAIQDKSSSNATKNYIKTYIEKLDLEEELKKLVVKRALQTRYTFAKAA